MNRWLLLLLLGLAAWATPSRADERLLSFHSDIEVNADGSMQVTETIRVRAEGREIQRGIYRDFPTDFRDRFGNRVRVDFSVIGVSRDGATEGWHTVPQGNGVRVYIGRKEALLPFGEYLYALTYHTNRQLGFFDDHDELYWNVTGNDWAFPIYSLRGPLLLSYSLLLLYYALYYATTTLLYATLRYSILLRGQVFILDFSPFRTILSMYPHQKGPNACHSPLSSNNSSKRSSPPTASGKSPLICTTKSALTSSSAATPSPSSKTDLPSDCRKNG